MSDERHEIDAEEEDDGGEISFHQASRGGPLEEPELDMTPMIDVTFQLLIFFLVAGMADRVMVALPPAKHAFTVPGTQSILLMVKPGPAEHAQVMDKEGKPFSYDLETQEFEIAAYVQAGLNGTAPFTDKKEFVLIQGQKDLKHREVARVCKAVARASDELTQLHIAVLDGE